MPASFSSLLSDYLLKVLIDTKVIASVCSFVYQQNDSNVVDEFSHNSWKGTKPFYSHYTGHRALASTPFQLRTRGFC